MAARTGSGPRVNRTALITGASGGLGRSVAERFLANGWRSGRPGALRDGGSAER